MYQVSEDTKKIMYQMFGRTQEMVEDDVAIIKTWMQSQAHLPEIMEDAKIRNFLNLNKFSLEKTKEKIDMYYTIRSLLPDFFDNSNPKMPNIKRVFETTYISTHPTLLNGIHRVYLIKSKEPNTMSSVDLTILFFAIFEVRLYEDFMVDDVIVFDMATFSLGDVKKLTPTLVSKFLAVYKKVYSLRLKNIVYLNCPSYVSHVVTLLKAIMPPKIFDRIQLHQDSEVMKELFSKNDLPKDYGGDGPSLKELNEMMQQKLCEYQHRFDLLDTLKVNESLRPEKLDNDEVLGFYGTFKKLNVD